MIASVKKENLEREWIEKLIIDRVNPTNPAFQGKLDEALLRYDKKGLRTGRNSSDNISKYLAVIYKNLESLKQGVSITPDGKNIIEILRNYLDKIELEFLVKDLDMKDIRPGSKETGKGVRFDEYV